MIFLGSATAILHKSSTACLKMSSLDHSRFLSYGNFAKICLRGWLKSLEGEPDIDRTKGEL